MKKRFSKEQIIGILKDHEDGLKTSDAFIGVCERFSVSIRILRNVSALAVEYALHNYGIILPKQWPLFQL